MYVYIDLYIYIYIQVHKYIHLQIYIFIYIHIHVHAYTYIHSYIHTYIHTYTYIYMYMHTYTYIHTYIHDKCTHSRHLKRSTYKRWLVCLTPNTQMKAVRQCTAMDTQILRRRRSWHRCSPLFSVLCYSVVQSSHICVDAKSGSVGNR